MEANWPLAGRRDEVELIKAVCDGDGVLLCGGAGVGKTRLLREAIGLAREAGRAVELVAATQAAASVPLSAVSHLLSAESVDQRPDGLFRLAALRLLQRWQGSQVVLAVDDAHLLDDGSAALVHYLCAHRHATLVATVRSGESAPDAVTALWKDDLVRRIDVLPLDDSAVDRLVGHALPGHVAESTRIALRDLAAGNPLYLRELLFDGVESGALWRGDGVWQWRGLSRGARRLRDLVETRLRTCGEAGRTVVELVACGEPISLALLRSEPGLDAAERAGMLDLAEEDIRLAHPIYGEVLRANLGPIRLREIHRGLAERLAATPLLGRDDVLRLATWQLAGGLSPDVPVLLPAARDALVRHDFVLAERFARAAMTAGAEGARTLLAEVLHWQGRHDESMALLATGPADDADHGRWLAARARNLYFGLSRLSEAVDEVAAIRVDNPAVSAVRAMMLMADGRCEQALGIALGVLGDDAAPPDTRLWSATAAVNACGLLGRTGQALVHAEYATRLAEQHSSEPLLALPHLLMARANSLLTAGRLRDARTAAERGYQEAIEIGDRGLVAWWATLRGSVAQVRGDLTTAVASLREAVAIDDEQDPIGHSRHHLMMLAGVLAMSGEVAEAQSCLRRAEELDVAIPRVLLPQAEKNRAWVAAAAGEPTVAAEIALRGAELARETELPYLEASLLYDAVRHGHVNQVHQRIIELAREVESELVLAYATAATARAHNDGSGLDAAAAVFEELDAPLPAVECLRMAGAAYRAAGQSRRANATTERARLVAARNGLTGVRTEDPTLSLTQREREIALLAARPSTSKEIAGHLQLSVRTVNNHLARVYAKLGVSGRTELCELLN
ncbi:LuxR C-terminal-related transcriptional regulator [Actinocrispum wychmicini]|uniref:AAA domain-containing protein n=1 Tax=Actinocrispum wychmicini TaxID=1213861 RepID=A0A4R2J804_9PSEU|nr:LuxR C-terminal-related transcriptional regulator [Actinocrispum wychmicini]TCO54724.1 AAA domain-containing protein [Actinocrispum wychmicini]